jgi:hypothetical protein
MNELKEQYSKFSDEELLVIVYFEGSNYRQEAIEIAKSILDERGLSQPSDEILQRAKNYQMQIKDSVESDYDVLGDNIVAGRRLTQAVKKKDYLFIGKWLFWAIIAYGIFTELYKRTGIATVERSRLPGWILSILEIIFTIAIFGIVPVIFFFIYSLKLSPKQRREKGLTLFMPKYVFFVYGVSLLIFATLVILPRL